MRLLDISFPSPEQNLAFDEVLLDGAERGRTGETLRFWQSQAPFIVLGVGQAWRRQVDEAACARDGIPVLRRCSAGGSVFQGPGCLNFAVVLTLVDRPEHKTICGSYRSILTPLARAFQQRGLAVRHEGISDLTLEGRKVSGNAQKRRQRFFLHHGTLVYDLARDVVADYLREPPPDERPPYRGTRSHARFIGQLPMSAAALRAVVCQAFGVDTPPERPLREELEAAQVLAREKYACPDWTRRR